MSFGTSYGRATMASRAFTVSVVSVRLYSALRTVNGRSGSPKTKEPYVAFYIFTVGAFLFTGAFAWLGSSMTENPDNFG